MQTVRQNSKVIKYQIYLYGTYLLQNECMNINVRTIHRYYFIFIIRSNSTYNTLLKLWDTVFFLSRHQIIECISVDFKLEKPWESFSFEKNEFVRFLS